MNANPTIIMAAVVRRVPKPSVVKLRKQGAAFLVELGDALDVALVVGLVVEVSLEPLSSPTRLLLTKLLNVSSVVKVAAILVPLTQADGVSAVPLTKSRAEH
jgi:hypothetical protein